MRLFLLLFFLIVLSSHGFAQNYSGYNTTKKAGLLAADLNVTRILDQPKEWQVNALSGDFNFMYGKQASEPGKVAQSLGFADIARFLFTENADAGLYGSFMLPSAVYKLNEKMAVGLTIEFRALAVGNYQSPRMLKLLDFLINGNSDALNSTSNNDEFASAFIHTWWEFRVPFAYEAYRQGNHRLSFGLSPKILSGAGSGYIDLQQFGINSITDSSVSIKGNMQLVFSQEFGELVENQNMEVNLFKRVGLGLNLGARYSYYRTEQDQVDNNYLFDVGFSIRDLGSLKYTPSNSSSSFSFGQTEFNFGMISASNSLADLVDTLSTLAPEEQVSEEYRVSLPTSMSLQIDYQFIPNFYVNLQGNYVTASYARLDEVDNSYNFRVTPRYEDNIWSAYIPVSMQSNFGTSIGLGGSWKGLFLGSTNLVTFLASNEERRFFNLHFGYTLRL